MDLASTDTGIVLNGAMGQRYDEVLTPGAIAFLVDLHQHFNETRKRLLKLRSERQARFDAGETPDFLSETKHIREGDWKVGAIPADLEDRRVEITGPVDRKMIINALNSGAKVFMADFEDASSPTWANVVEGQLNLKDRWAGTIDFTDEKSGKAYRLSDKPAVLMIRPRGWHLLERHLTVDGEVMSGSLFDFGLYLFHNAKALLAKGTGPYFYLPKLESHLEARLWNEVFNRCGATELGVRPWHVQGDDPDRDAARGFRDGRDSLRAARPYRRAQLRPLGLYFLVHQEASARTRPILTAGSIGNDGMGDGVPQRLFAPAHQDLPPPRRLCDGRHGGADPGQGRSNPQTKRPSRKCAPTRSAKPTNGHDGTWVAHPGSWCRSRWKCSTG